MEWRSLAAALVMPSGPLTLPSSSLSTSMANGNWPVSHTNSQDQLGSRTHPTTILNPVEPLDIWPRPTQPTANCLRYPIFFPVTRMSSLCAKQRKNNMSQSENPSGSVSKSVKLSKKTFHETPLEALRRTATLLGAKQS